VQGLNIYDFSDYRAYLHDWFWQAKKTNKKLSFRYVAKQLGLSSPNHFHLVVSQKRHLSEKSFEKVVRFLRLNSRRRQYFKLLFQHNLAKTEDAKQEYARQIHNLRQAGLQDDMSEEQYRILSNTLAWYIKMGAIAFDGCSVDELKKRVKQHSLFQVEDRQIDDALQILVDMNLLNVEQNVCHFDMANVTTKWDFDRFEIKTHHANTMKLALETIGWPIDQRFFTSVTIPCNAEVYQFIVEEVRHLALRALEFSNQRITTVDDAEKVVSLQFAMFPYFDFTQRNV
jgi:uncharacterized protein (TIGR02147 family)